MQPKASRLFCKNGHLCGKVNNIRVSRHSQRNLRRHRRDSARCVGVGRSVGVGRGARLPRRSVQRLRAWAAYCALLAWLLGLEVLPNLHLWHHDATGHTHDSAGTIVSVRFGPAVELTAHWHRDGEYHDPTANQLHHEVHRRGHDARDHATMQAPNRDGSGHYAAGLAHRATAIAAAPAMPQLPNRSVLRDVEIALREAATLYVGDALAPSARGPPTKRAWQYS